jgi:hypothetical protein
MSISLASLSQKRQTYFVLYGFGALLLLIGIVLWWTKVSVNPKRVFWDTIGNSMSTNGVTLHIDEKSGTANDSQSIQYSLGTTNQVHAIRSVRQNGTTVKTESIGTDSKTFTRYTEVKTPKKDMKLDKVLNVWADPTSNGTTAQLLPQVALGLALPLGAVPVPIGYINPDDRNAIIKSMQQRVLYQVDFNKVKKHSDNGRLLYDYTVSMQPQLYLDTLKVFAQKTGIKELENIDTAQYANVGTIKVTLTIDAHSKTLTKVADSDQGYTETYDGYGVQTNITAPNSAISMTELQKRLSALQ